MSSAALDSVAYRFSLAAPRGAAPSRSRRPRRPETGGLDVVPSAHTDDVASAEDASVPRALAADPPDRDTVGRQAELRVEKRIRDALPAADGYRVFANVRWLGRTPRPRPLRDGEADIVIAHPDSGLPRLRDQVWPDPARCARAAGTPAAMSSSPTLSTRR